MAKIGAVYDAEPAVRTVADILPNPAENEAASGARARSRVQQVADRQCRHPAVPTSWPPLRPGRRRDPHHRRPGSCWWTAPPTRSIWSKPRPSAAERRCTSIVDFIHVLEYLWKAAWSPAQERRPRGRGVGRRLRPRPPGRTRPGRSRELDRAAPRPGSTPASATASTTRSAT